MPRTNSIATNTWPSSWPTSWTVTMLGCGRRAIAWASRISRPRDSARSRDRLAEQHLDRDLAIEEVVVGRVDHPIPPRPTRLRIWNRPICTGVVRRGNRARLTSCLSIGSSLCGGPASARGMVSLSPRAGSGVGGPPASSVSASVSRFAIATIDRRQCGRS